MWPRYFLGRMYAPIPDPLYLPSPEPSGLDSAYLSASAVTAETLTTLRVAVLTRLGDVSASVWTADEIEEYLRQGYRELAVVGRIFWDQTFVENLPRGFSCGTPWETTCESFSYGLANYTSVDEQRLEDPAHRVGPANHTCPDEATDGWLGSCGASTAIPATVDLPDTVTELERATWDTMTLDALSPTDLAKADTRFQLTEGEVFGYTWRQDGVRSFRKVRVPSAQAETYDIVGAWGILRDPTDLSGEATTGVWGIPRRIPAQHPLGVQTWGLPRRPYHQHTNVKVEHWREGRALDDLQGCELPARYALYLRDYAQAKALSRNGPGQDETVAQWYWSRWTRAIARVTHRRLTLQRPRVGSWQPPHVLGGSRPPRPRLPYNYGRVTR